MNRRQLESMRQRLQMESTKLQVIYFAMIRYKFYSFAKYLNVSRSWLYFVQMRIMGLAFMCLFYQELLSKNAQRIPLATVDTSSEHHEEAKELASEMEQVDSVKRSLGEMQHELREMYSSLSVPRRVRKLYSSQAMQNNCMLSGMFA